MISLSKRLVLAMSVGVFVSGPMAAASGVDPLTTEAARLYAQEKVSEATVLEEKAVAENPRDWLRYAALSYYYWQQGNIVSATEAGEKALALTPDNETALLNLAAIKEQLDDNINAAALYETVKRVAPENPVGWLGQARCLSKAGTPDKAVVVLKDMLRVNSKSFGWYQELGDTCLRMDQPSLAVEATRRAGCLATSNDERSANQVQLLLSVLRDNQIAPARELATQVFADCTPRDYELYVRSASALCSPENTALGKTILASAQTNLTTADDAEGFFRLGKLFEQKSGSSTLGSAAATEWINLAKASYQQAVALNDSQPGAQAKFHVALVGVLEQASDIEGMIAELGKAQALDQFGQLAPYLRNKAEAMKAAGKREPLTLQDVEFTVQGLNCNCHISRLQDSLSKSPGVVFVEIAPNDKPYKGKMLLDTSLTASANCFAKAGADFDAFYAAAKTPANVKFVITSQKPVKNMSEAVVTAQTSESADVLRFYRAFKPVTLVMPVKQLAAAVGTHAE